MFPYAGIKNNSHTSLSAFNFSYNCTTNAFTLRRSSGSFTFEEYGIIAEVVVDYNCAYESGETVRNHCLMLARRKIHMISINNYAQHAVKCCVSALLNAIPLFQVSYSPFRMTVVEEKIFQYRISMEQNYSSCSIGVCMVFLTDLCWYRNKESAICNSKT